MNFGGKDGRNPESHRLPKDVAQRQRKQKAQRMCQQPLPEHVGLRSALDWLHAGQNISMRQHHSLGVAGGAGGKQNLQRRLARKPCNRPGLFGGQLARPVFESELRIFWRQLTKQQRIAHSKFGLNVGRHACGELRRSVGVQRNHQHSARDAAVKGRNPLGAVFSPQQNAVARSNAPLGQKRGKASAQMRNLPIRGCPPPVALKADYGNLTVETAEIVEQCSQMIAHENTGTFMVAARTAGAAVLCCRHPSQSKIEAWDLKA